MFLEENDGLALCQLISEAAKMTIHERLVYAQKSPFARRLASALLRLLTVNIPPSVAVGKRLSLPHGAPGLVVHETTMIGDDVKLYQGVTLGRADTHVTSEEGGGRIVIADGAIIGAGAAVLFRSNQILTVGAGAVVGANAVVVHSVPAREIWAGVPAKRVGVRST